jgi:hypothetical protein
MGHLKQKRTPPKSRRQKRLLRAYYISGLGVGVLEKPFWAFQQWHSRIADQLDNERNDDNSEDRRA